MCGIAGIVAFQTPQYKNIVSSMVNKLTHRGPDFSSVRQENEFAFGHSRLSIVDLKSGNQPMSNFNHNLSITFNG
jgi:asparagine synthase (glutamine-hydrolysing)